MVFVHVNITDFITYQLSSDIEGSILGRIDIADFREFAVRDDALVIFSTTLIAAELIASGAVVVIILEL